MLSANLTGRFSFAGFKSGQEQEPNDGDGLPLVGKMLPPSGGVKCGFASTAICETVLGFELTGRLGIRGFAPKGLRQSFRGFG